MKLPVGASSSYSKISLSYAEMRSGTSIGALHQTRPNCILFKYRAEHFRSIIIVAGASSAVSPYLHARPAIERSAIGACKAPRGHGKVPSEGPIA